MAIGNETMDEGEWKVTSWIWNEEQRTAITNGLLGRSFCLIGAAGTGKTTTLRGMLNAMIEQHRIPMLEKSTGTLSANTPGVVLVSFTRRAVRNIAKQMPDQLWSHCVTIHKLLEYAPERYVDYDEDGNEVNKMRFVPTRHRENPLPANLVTIVVDESSMVDTELMAKLMDALPYPDRVQFIFLGDLNQLPPVYGHAILGVKLLTLPIVELTQVYRQALESPIISLALAVKNNNFALFNKDATTLWGADRKFDAKNITEKIQLHQPGRGKVTIIPWKKRWDQEFALKAVKDRIPVWCKEGIYQPEEDLILSPWNMWVDEINLATADYLGKERGALVWEVIAGFNKYYLAVGDKVIVDKQDAIILDIYKNPKYLGTRTHIPSKTRDRWGRDTQKQEEFEGDELDVDALLASYSTDDVEERKAEASHIMKVRFIDTDEEELVSKAATYNSTKLGYATTVHKAQGSECRRVLFITDYCHAAMLSRELVYTAITRAKEELIILMSPMALATAAKKPKIKGDSLEAKLEFFQKRLKEIIDNEE